MRIGIVSEEFSIYPPFGGIATANEGLVSGLALAGHDVELIYFPERPLEQRLLEQERKLRARVIELPEAHQHRQRPSARSYTAYRRLRDADYDVLCWPDYRGPGFYSMLAKRNGIAFQNCQQVILSYGPLAWCRECSANLHFRPEHAEIDHLERQAYRMADHVVFNSAYLSGWCQDKQYQIQHQTVIPSLVGAHFRSDGQLKTAEDFPHVGQTRPIKELAFFGRLETRKGFEVFIDALTRLQKQIDVSGMRVYFFGRPIKNQGLHSHIQIINKLADSPYRIFLVDDASTDEFLQFCKGREILAVMPSINDNLPGTVIECVNNQIPLVASNLGGIPEIIDPQHHGVLCEVQPETLCQRLLQALQHGHPIARPAYWPQQILDRWSDFLQQLAPDPTNADAADVVSTTATPAATPAATSEPCAELTVGLVHYNRPQLLKRSLMSILQQTLKPAKVIVVDDNSPDQQTLRSVVEPFRYLASDLGIDLELSVNSENIYLGACRNRILATATSKYILFLDDDDVAMPEMLAELYACAVRDDADVVVQQHYYLPEQDQQVTPYEEVINRRQPPVWFFRGDDTESGLFLNIFGPASCLFATEALRSLGGYTEQKGVGFEDYELIFKLALMDRRFSVHSEPLYAYRTNPNSMVQTTSEQANYGRVFRMLKEFLPQAKRPINVDVLLESLFSHHHSAAAKPASIKLHSLIDQVDPSWHVPKLSMKLRVGINSQAGPIHVGKSELYRANQWGQFRGVAKDWVTQIASGLHESRSKPNAESPSSDATRAK